METIDNLVSSMPYIRMNAFGDSLTKRDLYTRISRETGLDEMKVLLIIQKLMDSIAEGVARGKKVEIRDFGVFEVKVRRPRIGRDPHKPEIDVHIPARAVVKFKPGKAMEEAVLKLSPDASPFGSVDSLDASLK